MKTMEDMLRGHPVFDGLDPAYVELIAGCGRNVVFHAGEAIARQGRPAECFYLLRHGHVAVRFSAPGRTVTIDTLGPDEVLGWSWLLAPYQWHFDVDAVELTRAVMFEVGCLRAKLDADPRLGFELMRRFAAIIVDRLQATRLRLLDLYGDDVGG
jgi:CRP-like cAMP-binding protein